MKKRFYAAVGLVLACCLLLCGTADAAGMEHFERSRAYDGRFADISGWYTEYVVAAYESGLLNGVSETSFAPDATLRLGEIVTAAARIHKLYETGDASFDSAEPWYQPYYDYCEAQGLLQADEYPADRVATRAEVVAILANVLPVSELEEINAVEDGAIPDVPASEDIYRFYRAGVLTGGTDHAFSGSSAIKRSEMAAIVTRLTKLAPRVSVTLTKQEAAAQTPKPEATITVGGKSYYIGMTVAELAAQAGEADETRPSTAGFTTQIYGTDTYRDFFLAGVEDGKVVALYSDAPSFSYLGVGFGDDAPDGVSALLTDSNAGDTVYAVCLLTGSRWADVSALADESVINFHLVNAFRVCYGKSILKWSDAASVSARLHSEDMAENDYFSHTDLEGKSPFDRMSAQGIKWSTAGENICAGTVTAITSHHLWVNSEGHRRNMLTGSYTCLGVGGAFIDTGYYGFYWTQNFFS